VKSAGDLRKLANFNLWSNRRIFAQINHQNNFRTAQPILTSNIPIDSAEQVANEDILKNISDPSIEEQPENCYKIYLQ
jgi:hypothetical protein